MEYSHEEILQALKTIQDICKDNLNSNCYTCPFSKNGDCLVNWSYPDKWQINKLYSWRALI